MGGVDTGGAPAIATVAPNPDLVAPTTVAGLCETYPVAWGDFMARCYGGDAGEWASLIDRPCSETALAEKAGRVALDEAKVAECFAVLAGGKCLFGPLRSRPQCSDLVTGSVPVGEPCKSLGYGDECVPDAECRSTVACAAGTCRPRGIEGESCHGLFVDVNCRSSLECDGPSAVCKVPGTEGEPCAGEVCQAGLYCDAAAPKGTCRPAKTRGPCEDSRACAAGFTCIRNDAGAGACTRIKPTGASCTVGLRECAGYCSTEGICRVVAQEGEICVSGKDIANNRIESIRCGPGLFCDRLSNESLGDAICRRQLPLGAVWPETVAFGNPCEGDDKLSFTTSSAHVCAVCEP